MWKNILQVLADIKIFQNKLRMPRTVIEIFEDRLEDIKYVYRKIYMIHTCRINLPKTF